MVTRRNFTNLEESERGFLIWGPAWRRGVWHFLSTKSCFPVIQRFLSSHPPALRSQRLPPTSPLTDRAGGNGILTEEATVGGPQGPGH